MSAKHISKKTVAVAVFLLFMGHAVLQAQEKVVVGGSGGLLDEMQDIAKIYMTKHPGDTIEVLMHSMSTTGGLEGVKSGRLTIGLVSQGILKEFDMGKLVYRGVGRTPSGVAIHKSLPVNNLSESQICDIFSGKITSWKEVAGGDLKITVLTRKKDDVNSQVMREQIPCFKDLKIVPDAIALVRGSEVMSAIDKRPGTVAMVNVGSSLMEREHVKAVAINGVAPSPESVQKGQYRFFSERGAVTMGAPQGATKRFLDFAVSPEGLKIIARRGIIPLK